MTPEELETRAIHLDFLARILQGWIDWDKTQRDKEGLETNADTHIVSPPKWPSHGSLAAWIEALTAAKVELEERKDAIQAERKRGWAYWEMESKRLLEAWHDEPLTSTQLWCNGISPRSKEAKMSYRELVARGIIGKRDK